MVSTDFTYKVNDDRKYGDCQVKIRKRKEICQNETKKESNICLICNIKTG